MDNKEKISRLKAAKLMLHVQRKDNVGIVLEALTELIDWIKTVPKGDKGDSITGPIGPRGAMPIEGVHYKIPNADDVAASLMANPKFLSHIKPLAGQDYAMPQDGRPGIAPALIDIITALKRDPEFLDMVKGQPGENGEAAELESLTPEMVVELINTGSVQIEASKIKNLPVVTRELPAITLLGRGGGRAMLIAVGNQLFQDIQTLEFAGSGAVVTRQGQRAIITLSGGTGGGTITYEPPSSGTLGTSSSYTFPHPVGQLILNSAVQDPTLDYSGQGTNTITFLNGVIPSGPSLLNMYLA